MSHEPGAVVLRTDRGALLLVLLAVGFVEAGLLAGMVASLRDGGRFTVEGQEPGMLGPLTAWSLLGLLALVLAVALVLLAQAMVRPVTTALSPAGYRRERRGRVAVDVRREDLTGVRFRPAAQATWQRSDAADPSVRGVGRTRLHNRIELRSPQATVQLTDTDTGTWPSQVEVVRTWVRDRPDLVDDDVSRAFLLHVPTAATPGPQAEQLPGWAMGLVALAVRRRDPWAPFLPDAYGRYSAMFNGRYTAVRARRRGSRWGLVARWGFLALWFVPLVVLAWLVVRVVLLLL